MKKTNIYTQSDISKWQDKCRKRQTLHYAETDSYLYDALDRYSIKGNDVLIIGSQEPCYEALALLNRANSVTVVEFIDLKYDHPNIKYINALEFKDTKELYDCALSISSVEHSGLGRYGDPIEEDGDLQSMGILLDKLKDGGVCFLAVPVGNDRIEGNLHRVYGERRLPMLLSGWDVVEKIGFDNEIFHSKNKRNQPLFVLKKKGKQ